MKFSNYEKNLRHTSEFSIDPVHVYNGTKSASFLGPKIWIPDFRCLFLTYMHKHFNVFICHQHKINY